MRAEDGDVPSARRSAQASALAHAVETLIRRHVPGEQLERRAGEVRAAFLSVPQRFVLRYALVSESEEEGEVRVVVDVEVDRERLLGRLRSLGFTVLQLDRWPRVLVVADAGAQSTPAARALRDAFEAVGVQTRTFPGEGAELIDESVVSQWSQSLGCHLAVVVTAILPETHPDWGGVPPGKVGQESVPAGPAASKTFAREDRPTEQSRVPVVARGWVVDARSEVVLGRSEVQALGVGPEGVEAAARGAVAAGTALSAQLVAIIEQSGWRPGEVVRSLDLQVEGLPSTASIEDIGTALSRVAEVRDAALREVSREAGAWRLEVYDSGLGWESIVGTVQLRRGRLGWLGGTQGDDTPARIRVAWTAR